MRVLSGMGGNKALNRMALSLSLSPSFYLSVSFHSLTLAECAFSAHNKKYKILLRDGDANFKYAHILKPQLVLSNCNQYIMLAVRTVYYHYQ